MGIRKYFARKNATISNSRLENLLQTASYSNTSLCDSGMIFSLYNSDGFHTSTADNDIARILIDFDINSILSESQFQYGNVSYYFNLYNIPNSYTSPISATISIFPLTKSFGNGNGVSLDFEDFGAPNWFSASIGEAWENPGGDFNSNFTVNQNLPLGIEDISLNITPLITAYRSGTLTNHGFIIKLSGSLENQTSSYYKKLVSMSGTEFFFNRPNIEVRFDNDLIFDDRNNSYKSSTLATGADNLNTLYFYNRIKGNYVDIPSVGTGSIFLEIYTGSVTGAGFVGGFTGSRVITGIYSASFHATGTNLIDVWKNSNNQILYTGTLELKSFLDDYIEEDDSLICSMPNLQASYGINDSPRLNVFFRKSNWQSNIYLVANQIQQNEYLKNAFFKIERAYDNKTIIDFSTASNINYSKLSYDANGNYFYLNMNLLEPNYQYEISFCTYINNQYKTLKNKFKFRVS